ncbi:MAG: TlpA family protein disulfide reductase [Planctomycetota bacterium]|jgi:peroxiredoxin
MRTHLRSASLAVASLVACVLSGCASGPPEGATAPAFSAMDTSGAEQSTAALEGKIVVMDFWATWCPPCVEASPAFQTLHEQFEDDPDVIVLGVHFDDRGDPAAYMTEHGYTFPIIADGGEVARTYGIRKLPTVLIVDREGIVVHNQIGFAPGDEAELAAIVQRLQ